MTPFVAVSFIPLLAFAQHGPKPEYVPGELIVKLKVKSKSERGQAFMSKAFHTKAMKLKGSWNKLNMHHFSLKAGQSVDQAIAELRSDPDVEYAEPNYIVRRQSTGLEGTPVPMDEVFQANANAAQTPSDSVGAFSSQSSLGFTQTYAPIQLEEGWAEAVSASFTSVEPTVVAVIDTGLDFEHDVFQASQAIWANPNEELNGLDDDRNGYVDDIHGWNFYSNTNSPQDDDGHGTHVSGIVLGATQSITTLPLAEAKVKIMPLKFLGSDGSGTTADAIKAIYYAVNNGARVLNNSWGGGGYSAGLLEAIAYAYEQRVVFVAAAGNMGSNNDSAPTYPANYPVPNLISIAATSDTDSLASFSNYGAQTVHMGAPGVQIYSTFPGNQFAKYSGTSMATPFVSGVAALMLRENPEMSGYQVKSLIFEGADPLASLNAKTTTQSRLNVYQSVLAAKGVSPSSEQPEFSMAAADRAPTAVEQQATGCGLVTKGVLDASGKGGPGGIAPEKNLAFFGLLLVLIAPVLLVVLLRSRKRGIDKRRHPRYVVDSQVRVRFGDRELVGQVSTISLGGLQLNTDAWLANGGVVKMAIRSPDGRDEIEVEGRIVWSEANKRYGVQFAKTDAPIRHAIERWTQGLSKA